MQEQGVNYTYVGPLQSSINQASNTKELNYT